MLGKPEIIGIDIGSYAVKVARVKSTGAGFAVNNLIYEAIPREIREKRDRDGMTNLVTMAVKKAKLAKGTPVIHINIGDCIVREVFIPAELRGIALEGDIEYELSNSLPFSVDQVYFDYDEIPNQKGMRLTVAARRDLVDNRVAYLSRLPKSFVDAEVDADCFSLGRLLQKALPSIADISDSVNECVMIVDIGYTRCRFYVYQGDEMIFSREQQVGGQQVNEIIMDVFDVDDEMAETRKLSQSFGQEYTELVLHPFIQTFSEQMNLAIDFFDAARNEQQNLSRIFVTGGGSLLPGFVDALNQVVDQNIRQLNLSPFIRTKFTSSTERTDEGSLNFALAIGLAMEGK